MSIIVAHEKRRKEILENSLDVFVDEGFENATFQKIADRCNITRTTLYIYFKNKREIFNYSIKQLLETLEEDISKIRNKKKLSINDQLIEVMSIIIDKFEENKKLLSVVLDFVSIKTKGDGDPDYRVKRRTVRLRHILNAILIEGIRSKQFAKLNIKEANEALYGFLEAAFFRLTILKHKDIADLKKAMIMMIRQMAGNQMAVKK